MPNNIWDNVERIAKRQKLPYGWKKELRKTTGITYSQIYDYSKRGKIPRSNVILELAKYLNTTADEILTGIPPLSASHHNNQIQRTIENMELIEEDAIKKHIADITESYAHTNQKYLTRITEIHALQAKDTQSAHPRKFVSRIPEYDIDMESADRALLALAEKGRKKSSSKKKTVSEPTPLYISKLPDFDVAAGNPIDLNDSDRLIDIESDAPLSAEEYFTVTAHGESMTELGIKDGERCLCKRQPIVDNGDIAVVNIADGATLKKLFKKKNALYSTGVTAQIAP